MTCSKTDWFFIGSNLCFDIVTFTSLFNFGLFIMLIDEYYVSDNVRLFGEFGILV